MLVIYLVPSILTLKILYDYVFSREQIYHNYCVIFRFCCHFRHLEINHKPMNINYLYRNVKSDSKSFLNLLWYSYLEYD